MSGRPTAEIVADLRDLSFLMHEFGHLRIEAADRLTEVAATLPDCPTCGGKGKVIDPAPAPLQSVLVPCPDCVGGKVTVAQMAALWEAVHDMDVWDVPLLSGQLLSHLRSVRP